MDVVIAENRRAKYPWLYRKAKGMDKQHIDCRKGNVLCGYIAFAFLKNERKDGNSM